MNASTALETAVQTAFLGVDLAVENSPEDYEHNGFDRIDFAYTMLEQVTAIDTAHDWTEQLTLRRHGIDIVKQELSELMAAREAEEADLAASFQRHMEKPMRNLCTAVDNMNSLIARYNTVSRFTAETVGDQDPEQFDWNYFEEDLGDMESVFADTFEGSGQPSRAAFARTMREAHYKLQEAEGASRESQSHTDTERV